MAVDDFPPRQEPGRWVEDSTSSSCVLHLAVLRLNYLSPHGTLPQPRTFLARV